VAFLSEERKGDLAPPGTERRSEPSPEETYRYHQVLRLAEMAVAYRRRFSAEEPDWDTCWKYYHNKQWYKKNQPSYRSQHTKNYTRSFVEAFVSALVTDEPQWWFAPVEDADREMADIHDGLGSFVWRKEKFNLKNSWVARYGLILGRGCSKICWDKALEPPFGDISAEVIPTDTLLVAPRSPMLQGAPWVIWQTTRELSEVRKLYKDGWKVQGESEYSYIGHTLDEDDSELIVHRARSEVDYSASPKTQSTSQVVTEGRDETGGLEDFGKRVKVLELWWKDEKGKINLTVACNGYILHDASMPKYKHYPFASFGPYSEGNRFWSDGLVKQMVDSQDTINELSSDVRDWQRHTVNPQRVVNTKLLEKGQDLSRGGNRPGKIWRAIGPPGFVMSWDRPPNVPPDAWQAARQAVEDMEWIAGAHELTQGRRPAGITAARAIRHLAAMAGRRFSGVAMNYTEYLSECGEQVLSLIREFYTEPRKLRIVGDEKVEVMWYFPEKAFQPKFDVMVKTRRTAQEEVTATQYAIMLYKLGIYNKERLVRALPNVEFRDKILQEIRLEEQQREMQERMMMMAQMEAIRSGVPPGGGGPGGGNGVGRTSGPAARPGMDLGGGAGTEPSFMERPMTTTGREGGEME